MSRELAISTTAAADPRPADLVIELRLETRNECNTRRDWRERYGRSSVNRPAVSRAIVAELGGDGWMILTAADRALARKNRAVGAAWDRRRIEQTALAAHLLPCTVTVTRIAPKSIARHDGITSALKAIVDGTADGLGIDDDDPRVTWQYAQEKSAAGLYAIRVSIRKAITDGQ
jgi:hypothetical protein